MNPIKAYDWIKQAAKLDPAIPRNFIEEFPRVPIYEDITGGDKDGAVDLMEEFGNDILLSILDKEGMTIKTPFPVIRARYPGAGRDKHEFWYLLKVTKAKFQAIMICDRAKSAGVMVYYMETDTSNWFTVGVDIDADIHTLLHHCIDMRHGSKVIDILSVTDKKAVYNLNARIIRQFLITACRFASPVTFAALVDIRS